MPSSASPPLPCALNTIGGEWIKTKPWWQENYGLREWIQKFSSYKERGSRQNIVTCVNIPLKDLSSLKQSWNFPPLMLCKYK
jgi:hypothetical protein